MVSSTYPHVHQTRASFLVRVPESRLLAFGTWVEEKPWVSCSSGIPCCTSVDASVVASKRNLVSSRLELMASEVLESGTLGPEYYWVAGRNGHVDGCRALDLGCSKRMGTGP